MDFFAWKNRENATLLLYLAEDNFDLTRKVFHIQFNYFFFNIDKENVKSKQKALLLWLRSIFFSFFSRSF